MSKKGDETSTKRSYFLVDKPDETRKQAAAAGKDALAEWKDDSREHYSSLPKGGKEKGKHKKGGEKTHGDGSD